MSTGINNFNNISTYITNNAEDSKNALGSVSWYGRKVLPIYSNGEWKVEKHHIFKRIFYSLYAAICDKGCYADTRSFLKQNVYSIQKKQ